MAENPSISSQNGDAKGSKRCCSIFDTQLIGGVRPELHSQRTAPQGSLNQCQYESRGCKVQGNNVSIIKKFLGNGIHIAHAQERIVSPIADKTRWKT